MSGAGTNARPPRSYCWICSRKFHGNFHRIALVEGGEVAVHALCAEREKLTIKADAHLKEKR